MVYKIYMYLHRVFEERQISIVGRTGIFIIYFMNSDFFYKTH